MRQTTKDLLARRVGWRCTNPDCRPPDLRSAFPARQGSEHWRCGAHNSRISGRAPLRSQLDGRGADIDCERHLASERAFTGSATTRPSAVPDAARNTVGGTLPGSEHAEPSTRTSTINMIELVGPKVACLAPRLQHKREMIKARRLQSCNPCTCFVQTA